VRGRVAASEDDVDLESLPDFVVKWPGTVPPAKKK
jgi:hypothetical protein